LTGWGYIVSALLLPISQLMIRILLLSFCLAYSLPCFSKSESKCFGGTANGKLENGWQLPSSGKNFEAYSTLGVVAGRTYVHSKVYRVILAAYKNLEQSNPTVTYIYGEMGFENGGRFKPHKTHTNGLSVDFFVPVVDSKGKSEQLDIGVTNKLGYNIEFNSKGIYKDLAIDFESIAKHIDALNTAAIEEGIGISVVIFDNEFQKRLLLTATGKTLQNRITFSVKKPWVRHDEHYHIDFKVQCAK
jgi:penicillin-insensitive murein endopeptidase